MTPQNWPAWTREPLVHFLLAGAILFAFFAWRGEPVDPTDRTIVVDREQQAALAVQFERTLKRPPTDAELDTLVEQFVREEVLYREGVRLGLDQGDAVVRRRLSQKMDQLSAAQAQAAQPDDATLQAWLDQHTARFTEGATVSFEQVWFAQRDAALAALSRLRTAGDASGIGERISLPPSMADATRREVTKTFGREFAASLDGLTVDGDWSDPIASGFGFHLARVTDRQALPPPALADIRDAVEDDWRNATIAERRSEAYQVLRDAYMIKVAE